VLYDGACHLCNGTVRFIVARDPSARVGFAPLQSGLARRLLAEHGLSAPAAGDPASVVLVEGGRTWTRSTAVLRIARHLSAPWPAVSVLLLVPRVLRDGVYDFVARHRYRWFGRTASCEVPGPEVRGRLLDEGNDEP
jgi:predicted DCC family thiol-disulfide oxidoreductase YuxK